MIFLQKVQGLRNNTIKDREMSTIMPEGESIRKAIKWISEQLQENPEEKVQKFVHQAITRFDLSPKDANFLLNFYSKKEGD